MLEGAVAHHSEPPVLYQQPLQVAASIPSFLQFGPGIARILFTDNPLCILSLHISGRILTQFAFLCVPILAFCLFPIRRSGPCERRMPL
jgi:hypothetical protein